MEKNKVGCNICMTELHEECGFKNCLFLENLKN